MNRWQRDQMRLWRDGDITASPLYWAALVHSRSTVLDKLAVPFGPTGAAMNGRSRSVRLRVHCFRRGLPYPDAVLVTMESAFAGVSSPRGGVVVFEFEDPANADDVDSGGGQRRDAVQPADVIGAVAAGSSFAA